MAVIDTSGPIEILVDDAGLMWRRPRERKPRRGGLHGLEGLGELGFNWEGFGQAAAGIGGAVAGIIQAKKTGYAPQPGMVTGGAGIQGSASLPGVSGGFSMSPQTMMMLAAGAVLLVVMMKK